MREIPLFSKAAAYFLAFALILLLPAVLLTFNLQKSLMDPASYKAAFTEQGLYERIPELIAAQLTDSFSANPKNSAGSAQLLGFLDDEEITLILEEVVSEEWSKSQVEGVMDALFAFLNGETDQIETSISLVELKSRMSGAQSDEIFDLLIASMPPCTGEDLEAVLLGLLAGGEFRLPICALPQEILSISQGVIQNLLAPLLDSIPSALTVNLSQADFEVADPDQPDETSNIVDDYRTLRQLLRLGPPTVIALLVLIALFAVRTWRGLLRWWGWPLVLGSAVVLVPVLFAGRWMVTGIEDYIYLRAPQVISAAIVNTFANVVGQIAADALVSVGFQAVILMSAGLILIMADNFLVRRAQSKAAESRPDVG